MSISHVFSKSIAGFHIYRTDADFERMCQLVKYYQYAKRPLSYANFIRTPTVSKLGFDLALATMERDRNWQKRVEVLEYCLMNTHFHLIVKEIVFGSLSSYVADVLNSYTRAFNLLHQRKGPLWQSRFGRYSVVGDESLQAVTQYLYQNPVKAGLVNSPTQWKYSSLNKPLQTS